MNVLVTGATGAVGPSVVQAFRAAGHAVRTLSLDGPPNGPPCAKPLRWGRRQTTDGRRQSGEVEALIGDVTDPAAVQSALRGAEAVVHLAALLHIVDPPPALREKYERINVGGTATVVEAALKAGVKRIVLASTIAVYGPSNGQILNEDSTPHPDTFYARTKLAAEKLVLNAGRADGRPVGTILRFGAVYGARIKGNYERLVLALARNRFIPVGRGHNRRTLVYAQDLARAVLLAVQQPAAAGRIYNVTDGQFHALAEIIAAICAALGRRPPRFSIPAGAARRLAGWLEDGARLLGGASPVKRVTIDKYTEDIAVEGQRLQKELGFVPQYGLDAGWRETVREMREAKGL